MTASKLQLPSGLHVDLFSGPTPEHLFVMFGGSGVSMGEYESRRTTVHPLLADALVALDDRTAVIFVTCPPEVRIERLRRDVDLAEAWVDRVEDEVLPIVPDVPFWLVGHSGGAVLALCGLQLHPRCRGAYMLGADGVPADLVLGDGMGAAVLYYNRDDEVFGRNRAVVSQLVTRGVAMVRRDRPGRHSLESYIANGTLSEILALGTMLGSTKEVSREKVS